MSAIQVLGDASARDVIAASEALGDKRLFDKVAKVMADASPTLFESDATAYIVPIAKAGARRLLEAALQDKRTGGVTPVAPSRANLPH